MVASKRPPEATRAELDDTIAQIRARKADGFLIEDYWTAAQGTHPRTGEQVWAVARFYLADDGSDRVTGGQVRWAKGSKGFEGEGEGFHISWATQKNRSILKNAIKILGVSPAGLAGTNHVGRYTREELERSIALVRAQAPRLKAYHRAVPHNPPYRREDRGEWMNEVAFITEDGSDSLCDDGTYVSSGGSVCGSEAYAIDDALRSNVNAIDRILYRSHFLKGGRSRMKAHPFEKSPTLAAIKDATS